MFEFPYTQPENVGIPSRAILEMMDGWIQCGIEVHSFSIFRHGFVCAEGYWSPYGPEDLHLMYSATKSVTAIAIGFAVQEGALRMDETLAEIFGDAERIHSSLRDVTIEHLLTMSCGQTSEINVYQADWIKAFLEHEAVHRPGTHFFYNTAGVDLLVAILRRRTGCNLVEYLRPRLLDPLGISERACCGTLPDGTEIGGGGLFWRTEDFKRFTYFLFRQGEWDGTQLLPREWMRRATTAQIRTGQEDNAEYGYLIWMGSPEGTYCVNGMLGQFGICIPKLDAFAVFTANASVYPEAPDYAQKIVRIMEKTLLPAMSDAPLPVGEDSKALQKKISSLSLPAFAPSYSPYGAELDGLTLEPETSVTLADLLDLHFGDVAEEFGRKTQSLRFDLREGGLQITATFLEGSQEVSAAMDGTFARTRLYGETLAACCRWRGVRTLELELRLLERIAGCRLLFRFNADGGVQVERDSISMVNFDRRECAVEVWHMRAKRTT